MNDCSRTIPDQRLDRMIAARPPSLIGTLYRARRFLCEAMAATPMDDDTLVDPLLVIEDQILAARPTTLADAYRRLLALVPDLASDLDAPHLAELRAEIEAEIGGKV
ncbi:hypothetical protein [Maritimibacter fusiformis]|uniref:Uncharacterized protein n=1 Tax=Maritimibacter fusiformis TaxID=2603819 RepID=A0A5D0RJT3_9RHOB|nr:hypothetical protein [Maritimibacter fusiformis]TYB81762.1 hypothetical protein FVF75_08635 [Maritimibacter fusiformis]